MGIVVLDFPKLILVPGEVYKSEKNDKRNVNDMGEIADIVESKSGASTFSLTGIIDQDVDMKANGVISVERMVKVSVSLLEGILKFFHIGATATLENFKLVSAKLESIRYAEIKIAKLQNQLANFKIRREYESYLSNYYIVTKVFFCQPFTMTIRVIDKKQIEQIVKASKAFNASFNFKDESKDTYSLSCKKKIAFGVAFASIEVNHFENGRIEIVPLESDERNGLIIKGLTANLKRKIKFPKVVHLIDKKKSKKKKVVHLIDKKKSKKKKSRITSNW